MGKFQLLALSAIVGALAGCSTQQSEPVAIDTTASRDSVTIHHMDLPRTENCFEGWDAAELYKPTGIINRDGFRLTMNHKNTAKGKPGSYVFDVPFAVQNNVLVRDFQTLVELQVMPQRNGPVVIGDYYSYVEGFTFRVSRPRVVGNVASICLGIERAYAVGQEIPGEGTIPALHMDKASMEHRVTMGEPIAFTLEGNTPAELIITVAPIR